MKVKSAIDWGIRLSFAIIYIWFGMPKVFEVSPATSLVSDLLNVLLPFVPAAPFLVLFGVLECALGVGFLLPRITKGVVIATFMHLVATMLPLILLPEHTWLSFGVLSTEGQYVMKNVVLFAALPVLWVGRGDIEVEEYEMRLQ